MHETPCFILSYWLARLCNRTGLSDGIADRQHSNAGFTVPDQPGQDAGIAAQKRPQAA
jgi:hypothetical protein